MTPVRANWAMLPPILRRVHLDFHNPARAPGVGSHFDPAALVQTWLQARVNAVTVVFGLCACGNAYYRAGPPWEHPHLERDLLGELLPHTQAAGIAVFVHFSVQINDKLVQERPDWALVRRDGKRFDTDGGREWGWPCLNSGFVEESFWPQLEAFARGPYEIAGIFLDMVMYPQDTCWCPRCLEALERQGLDPAERADRERFEKQTVRTFLAETRSRLRALRPEWLFTSNNQWYIEGARNENLDYLELEAPVTWNAYHFPVLARYLRTLPIASNGMTTRFPRNWGWFGSLNSEAQLTYEAASIVSTLGGVCIGDQLLPDGRPDAGVYELFGRIFRFVEAREPWLVAARSVPYLGILADDQRNADVRDARKDEYGHQDTDALYGAGLALLESSLAFDVLDARSDLSPYTWLWLPENRTLDPGLVGRVETFVRGGGCLLVSGADLARQEEWAALFERFGVRLGLRQPAGAYLEPSLPLAAPEPPVPLFFPGLWANLRPLGEAELLATLSDAYAGLDPAQRYGHFHPPIGGRSVDPAVVEVAYGSGRVVFAAPALAQAYFAGGSGRVRALVANLVRRLVPPGRRLLELDAPSSSIEVSLMRQPGRWLVHLVQFAAKRSTGSTVVDDIPPRFALGVTVRLPGGVRSVTLQPGATPLPFTSEGSAVHFLVPRLDVHALVEVVAEDSSCI